MRVVLHELQRREADAHGPSVAVLIVELGEGLLRAAGLTEVEAGRPGRGLDRPVRGTVQAAEHHLVE